MTVTSSLPLLGNPITGVVDGENNPVEFDIGYPLRGDPAAALEQLRQAHGDELLLLPISASSAGGGIFQCRARDGACVVGLRFDAPANPRVGCAASPDLLAIAQDEIVIDREQQLVSVGCAVTLDQLNRALADELGHSFKVPGADLTSYQYAAVGATFMTGGMGPQRRYFSDSVDAVAMFDGKALSLIEGESLQGYAGTYGWSGLVCALRCRYFRFPDNEIAFALPVSGDARALAKLLAHLAPYAYLDLRNMDVVSQSGGTDLVLGIEHVSSASMQPLLQASDNPVRSRALHLQQKCESAGADGLVFINGFSARSSDEFLFGIVDNEQAETLAIAGIDIEHAEVFSDPEEMRAVREAVPYSARTQASGGHYVYKNHSDANLRLPAQNVAASAERLWQINSRYVDRVQEYFREHAQVEGQILVYGHLNPYGVDPHNRVTMSSNDEDAFNACRDFLVEQRARFYRELAQLCADGGAEFIGGEKSADSEIAIYAALEGPEHAPPALFERFCFQRETIATASPMFNWRALPPYR